MRERLATNGGESSVLGRARFASRTAEKIKKGSLTLSKFLKFLTRIPHQTKKSQKPATLLRLLFVFVFLY